MWNDLLCEILCVWMCIIHIVTEKIYCFYLDLVWMQKEKQWELRKVSMMHIIQIPDFGLNHCDNLQKERTRSNWRAQSKNDPLIFRPFLKVFRSSWQLLLKTFKNGRKIKGSFLLWAFQLVFARDMEYEEHEWRNQY